jgi:DNA-binding transcriptional LysR family regulator
MVDPWSLRILVEVAERGSFSAAGEALALTQPAVSRQIGGLEKRYGVPLFRRAARGVRPTSAGAAAVDLARGVLARIDAMEATMRTFADLDGGQLRLAAFASANTSLVPEAIRRYAQLHPGVTVTLDHVDPMEVLGAVEAGAVDLALVTAWQLYVDAWSARVDPDASRLDPDSLDAVELVPLIDEQLVVAMPSGHPLAGDDVVALGDLAGETWVEGAHPDCLGPLPQMTEALGAPPRVGFVCHDWNGKQALVAAGAGVMVVPSLARGSLRPDVELRPTTPALPTRRLYVAVPRPPFCTPPARAMLGLLVDLVADLDLARPDVA